MGRYFKTSVVESNSREIIPREDGSTYGSYTKMLGTDEVMGISLDNGIFKTCPRITDEAKFKEFYELYASGNYITFHVFALPKSVADDPENSRP